MNIETWIKANPLLATIVVIWILVWKSLALWRSAERKQGYWFVALLLLNTLGILEIYYLFVVTKKPKDSE